MLAVAKCGGPHIEFHPGRPDSAVFDAPERLPAPTEPLHHTVSLRVCPRHACSLSEGGGVWDANRLTYHSGHQQEPVIINHKSVSSYIVLEGFGCRLSATTSGGVRILEVWQKMLELSSKHAPHTYSKALQADCQTCCVLLLSSCRSLTSGKCMHLQAHLQRLSLAELQPNGSLVCLLTRTLLRQCCTMADVAPLNWTSRMHFNIQTLCCPCNLARPVTVLVSITASDAAHLQDQWCHQFW
jgi:hypothetical protein